MLVSLACCSPNNSGTREPDPAVSGSGDKTDGSTQPGGTNKPFEPLPRGTKCNTVGMDTGVTLCVTADGGVVSSRSENPLKVPDGKKVKAVEADGAIYYLMDDGSVCDINWKTVSAWEGMEMVELAGQSYDCFGLRSDGAVVNIDGEVLVEGENIVSFDVGRAGVIACVRADGTMVLRDFAGGEYHGMYADAANWTDIVLVVESDKVLAGLKSDGTVVLIYDEEDYASRSDDGKNPELTAALEWTDIVSIEMNDYCGLVGVRADGTVTAAGKFNGELGNISEDIKDWTDIVAVKMETYFITGIKSNGSLVQIGTYTQTEDGVKQGTELKCDNAMLPW